MGEEVAIVDGGGISPAPTPVYPRSGSIIPAGTVDRIKSWMTESTIVTGYPNWQVAGGAVLAYMLLRKK